MRANVIPSLWVLDQKACREIRKGYTAGATLRDLSEWWRVSYGTVQRVVQGRHPSFPTPVPSLLRPKGVRPGYVRDKT